MVLANRLGHLMTWHNVERGAFIDAPEQNENVVVVWRCKALDLLIQDPLSFSLLAGLTLNSD